MFSPLHIQDLIQDSNNIRHLTKTLGFTVDEPIYFSGSDIWIKWVFCELKIVGDLRKKCQALIKLQAYKPWCHFSIHNLLRGDERNYGRPCQHPNVKSNVSCKANTIKDPNGDPYVHQSQSFNTQASSTKLSQRKKSQCKRWKRKERCSTSVKHKYSYAHKSMAKAT